MDENEIPFETISNATKRIRKKPILGNISSPNPILESQIKTSQPTQRITVKNVGDCATKITVKAEGSYPFINVAPTIDYEVTWTLKRVAEGKIEVTLEGWHNKFPAYEGLVDKSNLYKFTTSGTGPSLWNLGFSTEDFKEDPKIYSE